MEGKYTGAILAAGKGSRMQPFSERYPKPLLPVGNRPLIVHHIENMRSCGITDIVVLIGHKGYEIAKHLGDGSSLGVNLYYEEQGAPLGIAHGVGKLERLMDRPFLLALGDIYFVPGDLGLMFRKFEEQRGGAILATREDTPDAIRRNFSMHLSPEGYVTRVIEKPRHVPSGLKGVGLYLFEPTIFDAIRRTPRTALRDEYELTDSIQVFIEDGNLVRTASVIEDDINLTAPADLLRANLLLARAQTDGVLLGPGCRVHDSATIARSVLGRNVRVRNPITIEDSLVFDDTVVGANTALSFSIASQEVTVDCRLSEGFTQAPDRERALMV